MPQRPGSNSQTRPRDQRARALDVGRDVHDEGAVVADPVAVDDNHHRLPRGEGDVERRGVDAVVVGCERRLDAAVRRRSRAAAVVPALGSASMPSHDAECAAAGVSGDRSAAGAGCRAARCRDRSELPFARVQI